MCRTLRAWWKLSVEEIIIAKQEGSLLGLPTCLDGLTRRRLCYIPGSQLESSTGLDSLLLPR